MPITRTTGIKTGDLRLFEVQSGKIRCRYKIICNFAGKGRFGAELGYENSIITDS